MMDGPGTYPPPPDVESVIAKAGVAAMPSANTEVAVTKRSEFLDFRKDILFSSPHWDCSQWEIAVVSSRKFPHLFAGAYQILERFVNKAERQR